MSIFTCKYFLYFLFPATQKAKNKQNKTRKQNKTWMNVLNLATDSSNSSQIHTVECHIVIKSNNIDALINRYTAVVL